MPQTRASITLPEGMTLEHLRESLSRQIATIYGNSPDGYSYVEATLDGALIVCARTVGVEAESYFRHEWSIVDGAPVVSRDRVPVVERTTYEPVQASARLAVLASVAARKFRVRVIGTGLGANSEPGGQWYVPATEDGIGSARKTFGGARVHWHKVGDKFDHVEAATSKWLGTDHDAGYLSDLATTLDGLEATLHLDDDVPAEIVELVAARKVGLSIEAWADRRPALIAGRRVVQLVNFRHGPNGEPATVAIVTDPALRGEILRVAASRKEHQMPEIVAAPAAVPVADEAQKRIDAAVTAAEAAAKLAETEAKALSVRRVRADLDAALRASKLPEDAVDLVRASFEADVAAGKEPAPAAVQAAIEKARKLLPTAPVNASGQVSVGASERDRAVLILDRMLFGNQLDERARRAAKFLAASHGGKSLDERERDAGIPVAPFMGPRRALYLITGTDPADWRTGGYAGSVEKIRASVGATAMADMWADRMHKVTLAYYETSDYRTAIRKMAKVISVSDFRNVDFVALGGYGNLSAVPKGSDYQALSTPSSQGHEFTISKYGGTETIHWEDIVNDDQQVTQQTPRRLEDAYTRTLHDSVADKYLIANLTTDTTDYDSAVWCSTSRTPDNFNTTAFSATELAAVVKLMYQATDFSSGKRLGLRPKYLLHPIDLEQSVRDALIATPAERPGITTDYSYAQSLGIEPILIPHWTNAKDHVYLADPNGPCPPQVLAFLNGQEAPTIDVQDMRTVGSWFNKDTMTIKISGVWGNDLVRHEGIFAEDVA